MFSALLSFLGGSFVRAVWGEISSWITKKQDHEQEQALLRLHAELEDKAHERQKELIQLQHSLGVQLVEVQKDADVQRAEATAFAEAMKTAFKPIGIKWVDAWNAIIRPQFAQFALILWFLKVLSQSFVMDEWDQGLAAGVLGFFIADRSLGKRSK